MRANKDVASSMVSNMQRNIGNDHRSGTPWFHPTWQAYFGSDIEGCGHLMVWARVGDALQMFQKYWENKREKTPEMTARAESFLEALSASAGSVSHLGGQQSYKLQRCLSGLILRELFCLMKNIYTF